jgi:hypothetical protein
MPGELKFPGLTVITATGLETRAARRLLPGIRVLRVGVAFAGAPCRFASPVVSCGLAGGLGENVHAGTVVVATEVERPSGERIPCDRTLVQALHVAAERLGYPTVAAPLLTSATLIRGASRAQWARLGFAAADMETGLVEAPRLAAVRVVLDSRERELSEVWLRPLHACFAPAAWRELPWLLRHAPGYARRAAEVLRYAIFETAER